SQQRFAAKRATTSTPRVANFGSKLSAHSRTLNLFPVKAASYCSRAINDSAIEYCCRPRGNIECADAIADFSKSNRAPICQIVADFHANARPFASTHGQSKAVCNFFRRFRKTRLCERNEV